MRVPVNLLIPATEALVSHIRCQGAYAFTVLHDAAWEGVVVIRSKAPGVQLDRCQGSRKPLTSHHRSRFEPVESKIITSGRPVANDPVTTPCREGANQRPLYREINGRQRGCRTIQGMRITSSVENIGSISYHREKYATGLSGAAKGARPLQRRLDALAGKD